MNDIGSWLDRHGLGAHTTILLENDVTLDLLPELSDEDLKDLGLSLGQRRRLQRAIREELQTSADRTVAAAQVQSATGSGEAQRRQLTIMFADLVGSTELSSRLDPEEMREINRAYQDAAKQSIEEYEGYVARYMGDGVLAYFGYPLAHEDDAERAVRAGLDLVTSVSHVRAEVELSVRVGIATGPVVVGDLIGQGASQEHAVVGETPNLAARLQSLAGANEVVLGETTKRLVEGRVSLDPLGSQQIRGLPAPVELYRARQPLEGARFVRNAGSELPPMVGREGELSMLLSRWKLARSGEGQVVLLEGEPGIGKSRIVETIRAEASRDASTVLRYQCSPYHTNSAFHPVIEQLGIGAGFRGDDDSARRLDKLESLVGSEATKSDQGLIAELLSLPTDRYQVRDTAPAEKRHETIWALVRQLENLARQQPVLMLFEDLHWVDPSTQELLDLTVSSIAPQPVMLVATHRPEFMAHWSNQGHVMSLGLTRLSRSEVRSICARICEVGTLPDEVFEYIHQRTDGIPLFVEELTKDLLESQHLTETTEGYQLRDALPSLTIPSTVKDALTARLDRLDEAKKVAQVGAVIGRAFLQTELEKMTDLPEVELASALERLIAADLLVRRGSGADASFTFRHALVRDAAYDSLLLTERQKLHERAASIFQASHPPNFAVIAFHHEFAGAFRSAVSNLVRAARRGARRAEHNEAFSSLARADELCTGELTGREELQARLEIELARGAALISQTSYGNPAVGQAYRSAAEMAHALKSNDALFSALRGEWTHLFTIADLKGSLGKAEELLAMAGCLQQPALMAIAHQLRGQSLLTLGHFLDARDAFGASIELADRIEPGAYGRDASVFARTFGAITQWALGYGEVATQWSTEGLEIAKSMDNPFVLGQAYMHTLIASPCTVGKEGTFQLTGEVKSFTETGTFGNVDPYMQLFRAWSDPVGGDASLAAARGATEVLDEMGAVVGRSSRQLHLAQCELANGCLADAQRTIDRAMEFCGDAEELLWYPEVLRTAGLVACTHSIATAEELLKRALVFARERGARGHELRVSLDLAVQLRGRGDHGAARELLAPQCAWFETENHTTPDLQSAKEQLRMLSKNE